MALPPPVLFILMRTDLKSMNAGKAMAHAAHAANAFVHKVQKVKDTKYVKKLYLRWAKETPQGFGTTIVKAANIKQFEEAIEYFEHDGGVGVRDHEGVVWGTVHDPEYPLRDGEVTHLIPLDTCSYIFCERDSIFHDAVREFPLHK